MLLHYQNQALMNSAIQSDDIAQMKIDDYNQKAGSLAYYDCPQCKNKGYIAELRDGYEVMIQCDCYIIRRSNKRLVESGIDTDLTLESFLAQEEWQKRVLASAHKYCENPKGWFYVGGQIGSGKSHVCTGIVRKLISQGKEARYMKWRDDSTRIKACVCSHEDYAKLVEPLKEVDVLYIDDFLKTNNGTPTPADVNLAFEILNARYTQKCPTIISSEYYACELMNIDEAVGSRIYEMSKGNRLDIKRDKTRNYRLKENLI